jgi:F-type H+-transporting ATPase subunit a
MEHHPNWFTTLLNKFLGPYIAAALEAVGIRVEDPAHVIPESFAMSLAAALVIVLFVLWLKPRLSADKPGGPQQIVEFIFTNPLRVGIYDLLDDNVGHHGRKYAAMVGTISLFILVANSVSLTPVFASATIYPAVPLSCALITFVYYHYAGISHLGLGRYLKHFAGPVWWLAPLLIVAETISHFARILSLTVRLFANIFASELLYFSVLGILVAPTAALLSNSPVVGALLGLVAAALPIAFVLLHAFVAVMQAFIFTILPSIYLGLATSEEH